MNIRPIDAPIKLEELHQRITSFSNWKFAWQFYEVTDRKLGEPEAVRNVLDTILSKPPLLAFLANDCQDAASLSQNIDLPADIQSAHPADHKELKIQALHEHCLIAKSKTDFLDVIAGVSNHLIGAYATETRRALASEKAEVEKLFSIPGEFEAYSILPGNEIGCVTCQQTNHHLFSDWFYDVAWDFCYIVGWPQHDLIWIGCLTDTD